ncbi:MAG: hypothetical protein DRP29_08080 [Thermodesulfobacteriota bacterium]|nr:MAG: hypothetical protein DRP29_08080 [Thermodesulfobacteriota bacterium]
MKIKKFTGKNIAEALSKVRKELGEDAVILDSIKIKRNGTTYYEIVAAIDEQDIELSLPQTYQQGENINNKIIEELKDIKNLIQKALQPQLKNWDYLKYLEMGIPYMVAKEMIEKGLTLSEFIEEKIKEKGAIPNSKYQVFIGENGAGKTSGIFKLAIWYKCNYKANIIIISLDNYKVGSHFQSKRLADLLEIDFEILDIRDFKEIAGALNKYDYVLVDTPGLEEFWIDELRNLVETLSFLRFQWVIKATEHYEYALKFWEKIAKLPVEGIFLTFTDRIFNSLPLLWLLDVKLPPITFLSTGKRIPEDISRGEERILKNFFLRGIEKQ